jgi:hypothetical protein
MSVGQTFQLLIIGGLILCYVVSAVASGYAASARETLAPDARERVYQRLARWHPFLYGLDALGVCGLILGMARVWGFFRGAFPSVWGFRLIVLAVAAFCLERTLHAWAEWSAQREEPDAASSRRRALLSAVAVTLVQGTLAVILCWWVFANIPQPPRQVRPEGGVSEQPQGEDTEPPRETRIVWVSESRALEILGKDKAYLELLAPYDEIPTRVVNGQKWYRKDFIEKRKEAGLPSLEELTAWKFEEDSRHPTVAPERRVIERTTRKIIPVEPDKTEPPKKPQVPPPPPKQDDSEVLRE